MAALTFSTVTAALKRLSIFLIFDHTADGKTDDGQHHGSCDDRSHIPSSFLYPGLPLIPASPGFSE